MTSNADLRAKIWETLGIEPTVELGPIRRAYAEQLRRTRPDDDRRAFEMLRWAYESARELARRAADHETDLAEEEEEEEDECEGEAEGAAAIPADVGLANDDGLSAWEAQWARMFELQQAISRDAPADEVRELFEAIVSDPAMANVSIWEQIVDALTVEAAQPLRAADPLVEPVLDRLGGRDAALDWRATPAQQALLERAHRIEIRGRLSDAADPHHRAYRLLCEPRSARGVRASVRDIRSPLRIARVDEPWLMDDFDARTVEHWRRRFRRNPSLGDPAARRRNVVAILVVLGGLLLLLALGATANSRPAAQTEQAIGDLFKAIVVAAVLFRVWNRADASARRRADAPPAARNR